MKTQNTLLRKVPHAALAAILSLSLILRPAYAVTPGEVTTSGGTSLSVLDGNNSTGYFLQSGIYTISDVTLQNFSTVGGSGSGGGAGLGGVLFINSGATVTLNNVNFLSNNITGGNGGLGLNGGVLNGVVISSGNGTNGSGGSNASSGAAYVNGGNGGNAYHGASGGNGTTGFGGAGGSGGNGSDGSPVTADTVKAGLEQAYALTQITKETTESGIFTSIAGSFTAQAAAAAAGANAGGPTTANLAPAFTALAATFTTKASQSTASIAVEVAKELYEAAYLTALTVTALSEGAAGHGGSGGNGGLAGRGSDFFGGGAGGNGGGGGNAYAGSPSIAQGGAGGNGGGGGTGGFGGGGGKGGNGGVGGSSAAGVDGATGGAGAGGLAGFGGGAGAGGSGDGTLAGGGAGGSGFGGAIFLRSGATLTITGNALFDGNGARGGDGQVADATTLAGAAGGAAGSDIFLMKGSFLVLNPGAGNTITFNGDPSGSSIADDSAASGIETPIRSGQGAGVRILSGLVEFNGTNLYSGQTKIEGGTLKAQDGDGIYFDSNINFAGTPATNGVLMSNGDFTRYVGTQSNRVQWTGSGGFAANGGELNVRLSNGQTMTWGSGSFVPTGSALIFGSQYATDKVNFKNNINLGAVSRTVLVTANDEDTEAGIAANVDKAVFTGVLSGTGGLNLGDANHTGIVVLSGNNTFSGPINVVAGSLETSGSNRIADAAALAIASGASFKLGGNETLGTLSGAGNIELQDSNILTTVMAADATFSGVISGTGALTKDGASKLTLSGANTYTGATLVKAGTLETSGNERLADTTDLTVEAGAIFRLGGTEALGFIAGAGDFDIQANALTTTSATDTTVSGVISGSGGSITKAGTSKLTLTGANSYTGATTINDGTVALSGGGSLSDSTALSITAATGVFDIKDKTGASETIASIDTAAGSSVILGAKNLTAGDANDTTVAGTISGTDGSFTKTGSGKTTFTAANTYTGATTITDGTLALSAGGSLSDLTAVSITSATGTFNISAITASSETIASIAGVAGSNIVLGAKNLTAGDSTNTEVAGVISGTNGSLTKTGTGKLTLSGVNTYTGDTTVNAGTIETAGNERIDNASDIIVASGATFRLGGNESVSSIAGAGAIELQANTLVTNANVDTLFSGVIRGTDASVLTKTGTGKLTLSGANTSTGTANFNGGSADLTGSLSSKTINVASGFILDSKAGGLSLAADPNLGPDVNNNGTINLGSTNDTVKSYASTGTLNGPGTLTALNYNLNGGSIINANLGTGTITTNGTVDLFGTSGASTVVINALSVLNLKASELILNSASVTVNGILNLDYTGGMETFTTLLGSGTVRTNGNQFVISDGGLFTGIIDAPNSNLTTGTVGGGGPLNLGGGTTTTQNATISNGLIVGGGATLNSTTITIANGSTLDLSGGGTINFTTLTSAPGTTGIIDIGANDFIIPFGSTISGNITFIGTGRVINNGTITPGFSPGLTAIAGGTVLGGGAITKLELAGFGAAGAINGFDQLRLGGTLTANGTLNVAHFGGFTAAQGNSFQVLSTGVGAALAPGVVTGAFTTVTFDNDGFLVVAPPSGGPNPSMTPTAAFVLDLDTGLLTTTGLNNPTHTFADLGSNANQRGAAASIFSAATAGVGPNQIRTSTTAGLLAQQITDATGGSAADLARYVPDYYGSIADYAFLGDQVLARGIQDRVSMMNYANAGGAGEDSASQVPEHMSFFFGYMNSSLDTADNAQVRRNDYYAGVNLIATEQFVVGIAGSLSDGSVSAPLGQAEVEGFGAMLYARATLFEDWTVFSSVGYSNQDFDLTRSTVNGTATGSTDAATWTGVIGVQHKGWHWGEVSIAPRVSLTYSKTDVGGFSESGPIDALRLGDWSATRLVAEAGFSALWSTELAGRPFNLEGSLAIQQSLQNNKDRMQAAIISVPTATYPVSFAESADTQAVVRVNASYDIAKAVSVYTGYEGSFGGETAHHVKAGFRINF
jgi:fibronectin-binding autotransporter adhesin